MAYMAKYIAGAVVIVLIAMGGYYAWQEFGASLTSPPPPTPLPEEPSMSMYATSSFRVTYPSTYTVDDTYTYNAFQGKPIAGVKFVVPSSMATGTNLASDSGVSVEWLPRAQKCTGDIYLLENVKPQDMTMGSTTYSVATSSGAGAGNFYEEMVYAISGSKPCTAVRYLLHSGNIGNYPQEGEGAVREFDRPALIRAFDGIRDSLILGQEVALPDAMMQE